MWRFVVLVSKPIKIFEQPYAPRPPSGDTVMAGRVSCSRVIPVFSRAFLIACPIGVKSKLKSLFLLSISSPPVL